MRTVDIFLLFLLAAIWGSSYLFLKIAAPVTGVLLTLGLRITLAAGMMVTVFGLLRRLPDYRKQWRQYLVLGLLNLVIPFALITFSVAHLSASLSAVLNATTPFFSMVVAFFWLKERMTFRKIRGLLLGLAGLLVIVGWTPIVFTGTVLLSLVFMLLASFSYGLGGVYGRLHFREADPMKTATGQLSAAAVVVLPFLFTGNPHQLVTPSGLPIILILALVCTASAYALYFRLLLHTGPVHTSLVTLLVPVFGVIWGSVFLGESLSVAMIGGLVLILLSLRLVLTSPGKEKPGKSLKTQDMKAVVPCPAQASSKPEISISLR